MIELIATVESIQQARELIVAGINTLYVGEDFYGLRLPTSFKKEELSEIVRLAHKDNVKVCVAVNAIMHNDRIDFVPDYLRFLADIGVDRIAVGDPGIIHILKTKDIKLPYVYDAQILVTSAKQINFWVQRGAVGAVLAREVTYEELKIIAPQVTVPTEMLVYGATCIHQSKRPLVENYFNFIKKDEDTSKERGLFISEPKKTDTHYSIYEDINGTHIFATNDINLLPELDKLVDIGMTQWKLDGIFTKGEAFVEIAKIFVKAKEAFEKGQWTPTLMEELNQQILTHHPADRELDEGFFVKDPNEVK
ncbi:peptidase U32 family protein [Carnobacterium divergens]|uniref:peptidase U32 family protein n=1 Tax=Carnobacterium divergens TaxID=2748 RepID=UPI0028919BBB|nr:peptidase U32 family protein [Carnobacterium divergens]MDT2012300.1 U32 family peptidase [Carnobacterium divergens]